MVSKVIGHIGRRNSVGVGCEVSGRGILLRAWQAGMPNVVHIAPRGLLRCRISGLKGRDILAQGNALGTTQTRGPALKGRDIGMAARLVSRWSTLVRTWRSRQCLYPAPSGLDIPSVTVPRALSWASISRPFSE